MKIIQGDKDADDPKKADEPPAVDDDLTFDVQDQKMIEKGGGEDGNDKAAGYQRTVRTADDGDDERNEDEYRQQVEELKKGANIKETHQLTTPDILAQVRLNGKDRQFLQQETHQDIYRKIIQDEAAEGPDDILAGKKSGQEML